MNKPKTIWRITSRETYRQPVWPWIRQRLLLLLLTESSESYLQSNGHLSPEGMKSMQACASLNYQCDNVTRTDPGNPSRSMMMIPHQCTHWMKLRTCFRLQPFLHYSVSFTMRLTYCIKAGCNWHGTSFKDTSMHCWIDTRRDQSCFGMGCGVGMMVFTGNPCEWNTKMGNYINDGLNWKTLIDVTKSWKQEPQWQLAISKIS